MPWCWDFNIWILGDTKIHPIAPSLTLAKEDSIIDIFSQLCENWKEVEDLEFTFMQIMKNLLCKFIMQITLHMVTLKREID